MCADSTQSWPPDGARCGILSDRRPRASPERRPRSHVQPEARPAQRVRGESHAGARSGTPQARGACASDERTPVGRSLTRPGHLRVRQGVRPAAPRTPAPLGTDSPDHLAGPPLKQTANPGTDPGRHAVWLPWTRAAVGHVFADGRARTSGSIFWPVRPTALGPTSPSSICGIGPRPPGVGPTCPTCPTFPAHATTRSLRQHPCFPPPRHLSSPNPLSR